MICFLFISLMSTTFSQDINSPEINNVIQQSNYLPLSVGNFWIYKRVATKNREVLSWDMPPPNGVIEEKPILIIGLNKNYGVFIDTFKISKRMTGESGIYRWKIELNSQNIRDGRYEGKLGTPDSIYWGRIKIKNDSGFIAIGEIFEYEIIPVIRKYEYERPLFIEPINTCHDTIVEIKFSDAIILAREKLACHDTYIEIKYGDYFSIEAHWHKKKMKLKIGTFDDCLEIITKVKYGKKELEIEKEWNTYSYYAPNVGLILEKQVNPKNQLTYSMELIKYSVNK